MFTGTVGHTVFNANCIVDELHHIYCSMFIKFQRYLLCYVFIRCCPYIRFSGQHSYCTAWLRTVPDSVQLYLSAVQNRKNANAVSLWILLSLNLIELPYTVPSKKCWRMKKKLFIFRFRWLYLVLHILFSLCFSSVR